MANNPEVVGCIAAAIGQGLAEFVLIGPREEILRTADGSDADISTAQIVEASDGVAASREAARMAADGSVHVIMKGLVQTADFVRAILDKSFGLLPSGGLLSHVAALDVTAYHKTFYLTDAAITVTPDVDEKVTLIQNAVRIASSVGIKQPKVACIAPVEKVSDKVPSTTDAALVVERFRRGHGPVDALVDGPFGLDVAVSPDAARVKGVGGDVAGDADIILVPGIDAGNVLYKSVSLLAHGSVAGVVAGAKVPIVLTSRADSEQTKLSSVLLALASSP
jgi:phosphate butyryltransferase